MSAFSPNQQIVAVELFGHGRQGLGGDEVTASGVGLGLEVDVDREARGGLVRATSRPRLSEVMVVVTLAGNRVTVSPTDSGAPLNMPA